MPGLTEPAGGQSVRGSTVVGDLTQIGSARDVLSIDTHLPPRPPLPDAASTPAPAGLKKLPARRAAVFVGRDEALRRVEQALGEGAGVITQGPQAAVYGLGGIGKSELALQYALRNIGRYHLAWWIDADSPARIQNGLADLARAIAAGTHSIAAAQATAEEAAAWAIAWLAAHPGWLLIFDNVGQAADIEPVLARLNGGHVLITTRRATGWQGLCTPINLEVLAPDAAERLLAELIGHTRTAPASELAALAEELGWLPLALTQAGAYIARTPGMTVERYRHLLRRAPGRLQAAAADGHDPGRVVARVWEVTRSRIAELNPLAPRLLELLACNAPDRLPIDVLNGLPGADELDVAEALRLLASYSMITLGEDTVSVHRLVQSVTLARLPADRRARVRRLATDLLASALPDDPDQIGNWPAYARLLPHARTTLPPDSPAMRRVLGYLRASGDYTTAEELQRDCCIALHDLLGPEHPNTLIARANLAYWTGVTGDAAAARDQYAALLPITERVLGRKHPETLSVRANLAYFTGAAGDAAAARDRYAALLPIRERISGTEHPETLTIRANLARWTGEAGDAAAARNQLAALLPVRERISGAEHPETLTVRANLAYFTGEAGDAAAARNQLAALLPIAERVLGPEHPETLTIRANHASWTGEAGDAAAARNQLAALLPITQWVLGPEHPNVLTIRIDLAHWTGEAGDAAAARDQYDALLPVCQRVLGPGHPQTLTVRTALVYWTDRAGRDG
jgi:NB-ARC domain.